MMFLNNFLGLHSLSNPYLSNNISDKSNNKFNKSNNNFNKNKNMLNGKYKA
jgi:hypothetical protein